MVIIRWTDLIFGLLINCSYYAGWRYLTESNVTFLQGCFLKKKKQVALFNFKCRLFNSLVFLSLVCVGKMVVRLDTYWLQI